MKPRTRRTEARSEKLEVRSWKHNRKEVAKPLLQPNGLLGTVVLLIWYAVLAAPGFGGAVQRTQQGQTIRWKPNTPIPYVVNPGGVPGFTGELQRLIVGGAIDDALRAWTEAPGAAIVFTNADVSHARRVLAALELGDLFDAIVDVNAVAPYCKPMPESFAIALKAAGETDPARCVMIDDLPRTARAARDFGLFAILAHHPDPSPDADAVFTDWRDLPALLNGSKP